MRGTTTGMVVVGMVPRAETRTLRVDLHPVTMEDFLAIEKELRAGSHAETIRALIRNWKLQRPDVSNSGVMPVK